MIEIFSYCLLILILNSFIKSKNFLKKKNSFRHQKFLNTSQSLSGGLFLLVPILLIVYQNSFLLFTFALIFILGFVSDFDYLISPTKRFIFQILIIFIFIYLEKIETLPTRISFIDDNLHNTHISFLFTLFCLMPSPIDGRIAHPGLGLTRLPGTTMS